MHVKEFEELNHTFLNYCNTMLSREQLLAVSKGIVTCLSDLIQKVRLEGVMRIRDGLKKKEGEWEDSYWNCGLKKMHERYFAEVIQVLNAQWTVHESAINRIMEYVYVPPSKQNEQSENENDKFISIISNSHNNSDPADIDQELSGLK